MITRDITIAELNQIAHVLRAVQSNTESLSVDMRFIDCNGECIARGECVDGEYRMIVGDLEPTLGGRG